jgi:hypothetical protein
MRTVRVTKLPPGPEENKPIVGRLYVIYLPQNFAEFAKWPGQKWGGRNKNQQTLEEVAQTLEEVATEILYLVQSVSYAMLVAYNEDEQSGCIRGTMLVGQKTVDFWIPGIEEETCLDAWQRFFLPALGYYE